MAYFFHFKRPLILLYLKDYFLFHLSLSDFLSCKVLSPVFQDQKKALKGIWKITSLKLIIWMALRLKGRLEIQFRKSNKVLIKHQFFIIGDNSISTCTFEHKYWQDFSHMKYCFRYSNRNNILLIWLGKYLSIIK